jgi:hypothetical protein
VGGGVGGGAVDGMCTSMHGFMLVIHCNHEVFELALQLKRGKSMDLVVKEFSVSTSV